MEEGKIRIAVVSGLSGAGKTTASRAFEAGGYYVMEDLPSKMLRDALRFFATEEPSYPRIALIMPLSDVESAVKHIKADPAFELLSIGLVCRPEVLRSRYKLTRRIHPLMTKGHSLEKAIALDAESMEAARGSFDLFIDTSDLSEKQLNNRLGKILNKEEGKSPLSVIIASFGYKFGVPLDADLAIDARVLDNPFWVDGLKDKTGLDKEVIDFIEKDPKTEKLYKATCDYLDVFLPLCVEDGRDFVTIGVGCSGGQHRSVYLAERLYARYQKDYRASLFHREVTRYRK